VKNVLACVAAVAQRSRECSRSSDEFLEVLNGRITSLANAHALLSRSHWEGVELGELVRNELAPCMIDGSNLNQRDQVRGPVNSPWPGIGMLGAPIELSPPSDSRMA
jgi:two-component sensor histidine kinase